MFWYLSHRPSASAQTRLQIHTGSPEYPVLTSIKDGRRYYRITVNKETSGIIAILYVIKVWQIISSPCS